ncbi:uncharacterized protein SOCEGT47_034900 [Sorangium cellulosum]|uniref:Uncharacterized protein n=1 Tax=Sorangium cellulosum TaxID=56 RepID=A0A4P2Q187_SORCE|nr:hypothetical protein [Sorangium cellulosum]AUX22974.1 uncharacterized protein SOCEGT47_034900 [Sorangium cellulosum]
MISDVEIENEIRASVAEFLEGMRALVRKDILQSVAGHLEVDIRAAGISIEPALTPIKPARKVGGALAPSRVAAPSRKKAAPSRPAPSKPAPSRPALSKPALSKPATSKPATSRPALSRPAPSKPATSRPAPSKPAPSRPALSKPALSKPATSKPATSRPALSRPAPSKPATSRPAPSKPTRAASGKKALAPRAAVAARPRAATPGPRASDAGTAGTAGAAGAGAAGARPAESAAGEKAAEQAILAGTEAPQGAAPGPGDEISEALLAHVEIEPGQGLEELALAMGTPAADLEGPIKKLVEENKITEEMRQGQAAYYPT